MYSHAQKKASFLTGSPLDSVFGRRRVTGRSQLHPDTRVFGTKSSRNAHTVLYSNSERRSFSSIG